MPSRRDSTIEFDHVVLEVRDPEASVAFYRLVLGLQPVRLAAYRKGKAPFVSGRVNAQTVVDFFPPALWRNRRRPSNPNHFCLTLTARRASALERRLAARGVAITQRAPRNFGARGYAQSIYFLDPDGISVEARHYPAPPAAPTRNAARRKRRAVR
jgi:catechol 2,3-dioxygenase-like lactoylglutathione lyase family enzyme